MEKQLDTAAWVVLFLAVVYMGGHFIVATANGWDGLIDYPSMGTMTNSGGTADIEVNTGTRETVEKSGLLIPGGEIQVTDSEGEVHDLEVIVKNPDTGGPVQIEAYDSETNEYYDLEMSLR
jgi:hypothetical protein